MESLTCLYLDIHFMTLTKDDRVIVFNVQLFVTVIHFLYNRFVL